LAHLADGRDTLHFHTTQGAEVGGGGRGRIDFGDAVVHLTIAVLQPVGTTRAAAAHSRGTGAQVGALTMYSASHWSES
jgi:hypothetical protein